MADVLTAIVVGVAAGAVSGLLGVGGGILFVPALTLALGLGHLDAEATSLLAIVPVSALGAWRQNRYGNVRVGDGVWIGVLALAGVAAGVALANALPERALELGFAALMVFTAVRLARRGLRRPSAPA
jgi:uncharacterized protein